VIKVDYSPVILSYDGQLFTFNAFLGLNLREEMTGDVSLRLNGSNSYDRQEEMMGDVSLHLNGSNSYDRRSDRAMTMARWQKATAQGEKKKKKEGSN